MKLSVTILKLNEQEAVASTTHEGGLGLTVQQITPEIAESFGLGRAHGVVVTAVVAGSPADEAGLQPSDIIREINRKPIRNLSDYKKAAEGAARDKSVLFLVQREDKTIFLALRKDK
jgi:serine protease Do